MTLLGASSFAASNDALLDLLVKKGVLSESEATSVAAELKAEQPVYVQAKGKAVEAIKFTGRLQLQYDNIGNDIDRSSQNGFYFRRVFLGAQAQFANDWSGTIVADFGGGDGSVNLDEAKFAWKYDPAAEFEFGYTKVPFGLYETTSSSKIKTIERSIANRYFVEAHGLQFAGRHTGVFVGGDLGSGFSYDAAVVSGTASNVRTDKIRNTDNGLGFFGRLEWKSEKTDAGQLRVGLDAGHKQDGSANAGGEGDLFAYGAHANYAIGDFNLSGEFLGASVENGLGSQDADVYGITVIPSYKLTDKWEIVAAYSMVDSDGADLLNADDLVRRSNAGSMGYDNGESYYIGFNYYIKGNDLKLSGGYENANFETADGSSEVELDAIRLRLQMLF